MEKHHELAGRFFVEILELNCLVDHPFDRTVPRK